METTPSPTTRLLWARRVSSDEVVTVGQKLLRRILCLGHLGTVPLKKYLSRRPSFSSESQSRTLLSLENESEDSYVGVR